MKIIQHAVVLLGAVGGTGATCDQQIDWMKSVADAVARLSEALCIACFCKDRNSVESKLPASTLYGGRCTANATQQCKQIKANMYRVLTSGVAASEAAGAVPQSSTTIRAELVIPSLYDSGFKPLAPVELMSTFSVCQSSKPPTL